MNLIIVLLLKSLIFIPLIYWVIIYSKNIKKTKNIMNNFKNDDHYKKFYQKYNKEYIYWHQEKDVRYFLFLLKKSIFFKENNKPIAILLPLSPEKKEIKIWKNKEDAIKELIFDVNFKSNNKTFYISKRDFIPILFLFSILILILININTSLGGSYPIFALFFINPIVLSMENNLMSKTTMAQMKIEKLIKTSSEFQSYFVGNDFEFEKIQKLGYHLPYFICENVEKRCFIINHHNKYDNFFHNNDIKLFEINKEDLNFYKINRV